MMTSAQVVETSVTTTDNSPSQDYSHPDDQTTPLNTRKGHLSKSLDNCCSYADLFGVLIPPFFLLGMKSREFNRTKQEMFFPFNFIGKRGRRSAGTA